MFIYFLFGVFWWSEQVDWQCYMVVGGKTFRIQWVTAWFHSNISRIWNHKVCGSTKNQTSSSFDLWTNEPTRIMKHQKRPISKYRSKGYPLSKKLHKSIDNRSRVIISDKKTTPMKRRVCLHTKISVRGRQLFLINRVINHCTDSFAIIIVLEELH